MPINKSEIKEILKNPDIGKKLVAISESNHIKLPKLYKIAIELMTLAHTDPDYVCSKNEMALLELFTNTVIGDKDNIAIMELCAAQVANQQVDHTTFNPFAGIVALMNVGNEKQTVDSALEKIHQINDNVPDITFSNHEIFCLAQLFQPIELFEPKVKIKPIDVFELGIYKQAIHTLNQVLETANNQVQLAIDQVASEAAKNFYTKEHYSQDEIETIHQYAKIIQNQPDQSGARGIIIILDSALKNKAIEQRFLNTVKAHGMSLEDGNFLLLLNKDPKEEEDIKTLKKYCEQNTGNMELNTKLGNLVSALKSLESSDNMKSLAIALLPHITALRRFTYKSRHINDNLKQKVDKLLDENNNLKDEVPESDRLTLREAAMLNEVADTNEILKKWFNTTDEKPHFASLCEKAEQFRNQIENVRVDRHKIKSRHTLFAFHNLKQEKQVMEEESRFERLFSRGMRLITPYGHTATVRLEDDKLTMAHLTREFDGDDEMTYGDFLYNDLYRFDVSKLVKESDIHNMKKLFGDNWQRELNKLYSETERKVHDAIVTDKLTAGVGNKAYLKIGAKKIFLPKVNHFGKSQSIDDKVKAAWSKRDKNDDIPMLCSQYTAYTTMIAIEGLNHALRELAAEQGLRRTPAVKSPISGKENMKTMHPGQFFKVLNKQGCLIKISDKQVKKYIDK